MRNALRLVVLVILFFASSCTDAAQQGSVANNEGFTTVAEIDEAAENGVSVKFLLQEDEGGTQYLSAQFTPLKPGYYLYGYELPEEGIKGLGVPTRMKVLSSEGMVAGSQVITDPQSFNLKVEVLDIEMPVYEVGPVTLSLPVEKESDTGQLELELSYMACNKADGTCLPPVRNKKHTLTL